MLPVPVGVSSAHHKQCLNSKLRRLTSEVSEKPPPTLKVWEEEHTYGMEGATPAELVRSRPGLIASLGDCILATMSRHGHPQQKWRIDRLLGSD